MSSDEAGKPEESTDTTAAGATAGSGKVQDSAPGGSTVRRTIAIGSQRDVANPELAPVRPVQVQRAGQKKPAMAEAGESPAGRSDAAAQAPVVESRLPEEPPSKETHGASGSDTSLAHVESGPPATVQAIRTGAPESSVAARQEQPPQPPVPAQIRSRAGLGDDVEAEIAAALGEISMDDVVKQTDVQPAEPESGERIKVTVSRVDAENVLISIKGRFEGIVPLRQFQTPPEPGSMLEVIIKSRNAEDGLFDASVPGAASDAGDWDSIQKDDVVEARVTGANTGGLEVAVGNLRGFIPASQIERFRVEQLGDYVNQKLTCLVSEVNAARKKLVLSRRAILDREHEENRRKLFESLQPGVELEGIVSRLADFGAFVDIGGVEGLVHISKLSWSRIKHPREVVEVGQRVKVRVEKLEVDTGRIGLSHRDTLERPWDTAATRFPPGSTAKGTVSRIAQFGAFVRLDEGIEGLIHVSELAHHRVYAVRNIVKEGEEVEVKVLSVDSDAQKMALSLKALQAAPEKPEAKKPEEEPDAPRREALIKGSGEPLRGGTTRRSDGDRFGLRL